MIGQNVEWNDAIDAEMDAYFQELGKKRERRNQQRRARYAKHKPTETPTPPPKTPSSP